MVTKVTVSSRNGKGRVGIKNAQGMVWGGHSILKQHMRFERTRYMSRCRRRIVPERKLSANNPVLPSSWHQRPPPRAQSDASIEPGLYLPRPGSQNGNPVQRGAIMSRERILEVVLTMLSAQCCFSLQRSAKSLRFLHGAPARHHGRRGLLGVESVQGRAAAWTWIFVAVALLLNPFFPIRMQRAQRQSIDLCLGIFLIGWSGYWLFRKRRIGRAGQGREPHRRGFSSPQAAIGNALSPIG